MHYICKIKIIKVVKFINKLNNINNMRIASVDFNKMIPIPLIISTLLVGYLIFSGYPIGIGGGAQVQQVDLGDIPPLLPNAPSYKCPQWMDSATCQQLTTSCGNGVCDAHESCSTCSFDCGCGGAQVCNTQNGKCHSPAGVCQAPRGAG